MGMWYLGPGSNGSSWHNPVFPNADGYPVESDREEPDLVAGGSVADVMGFDNEEDWTSAAGTSYTAPVLAQIGAIDFDLLLHTEMNGGEYIYMSQSVDDSTEGFDVVVPETGRYTIYIAWPEENEGCESNGHEGVGWAWAISRT
jgi:hypothetical protein